MVKYIGQGNENQGWSCCGLNIVGKACREYDESGHESHQGVQQGYADRLSCQRSLLADIASEDCQGSDTNAQGEKGLSQGSEHGFTDTRLRHFPKIRLQVKLQPGTASRQNHGMHGQHYHQHQQTHHHDLCNALHALLKAHGADSEAQQDHNDHEPSHQRGISQHTAEFTGHCL